jgi:hypothetical protein
MRLNSAFGFACARLRIGQSAHADFAIAPFVSIVIWNGPCG